MVLAKKLIKTCDKDVRKGCKLSYLYRNDQRVIFINFQVRLSAHSESPNVAIHCAICCGAEKKMQIFKRSGYDEV